ncbi:glutamate racemase [Flaviflagellibacter deserti]|uniref:Glutamate racemase n=1 Tax=Flaviflagellibacter deserti TaxID=2267266 RepID=A0ABV9Z3Y8_9HYPH
MRVDLLAGTTDTARGPVSGRPPRVGVFDSGMGGLTVHSEIATQMAGSELVYIGDTEVFPYGRLAEKALVQRVSLVMDQFIRGYAPDIVCIACNTASTLALPVLRARHDIPFVGTVPAIKPAVALSKTRRISVLATMGTVARDYTHELVAAHAQDCEVNLVGSKGLASLAEAVLRGETIRDEDVLAEIAPAFVGEGDSRTDVIVLACTHYPLILDRLTALAPWPVNWIDPAPAIARRVAALVGPYETGLPVSVPRALFTQRNSLPIPLLGALSARGFGQVGLEAIG